MSQTMWETETATDSDDEVDHDLDPDDFNLTVSLCVDGVNPNNSGGKSISPMILTILDLPPQVSPYCV